MTPRTESPKPHIDAVAPRREESARAERKPAPVQEPADTRDFGTDASRSQTGPEAAFREYVQKGEGLPSGLGAFLKAARITETEPGKLLIELPSGPGLEKLTAAPHALHALETAIAARIGRAVSLQAVEQGVRREAAVRLTPEMVRKQKLASLTEEEPVLGKAVESWDLELLD